MRSPADILKRTTSRRRLSSGLWIAACVLAAVHCDLRQQADAAEPARHVLNSQHQAGTTSVTVLLPDSAANPEDTVPARQNGITRTYSVLYILPVEAGEENRWGNSLQEVLKTDIHNRFQLICVFPTFSDLPWYADHPDNPRLHQETYFLKDIIPFVEKHYPARTDRDGRLLAGFSKSGWGAWSLLLRHPNFFGQAAAFDAPLMMDAPGKYGSGPVFGTQQNFDQYCIVKLLERRSAELSEGNARLTLIGKGNFETEHVRVRELMQKWRIPFHHQGDMTREHSWHSGWLLSAVERMQQPR